MPFGVDLCRFGENKNAKWLAVSHLAFLSVRLIGLEPTRRETPDPNFEIQDSNNEMFRFEKRITLDD